VEYRLEPGENAVRIHVEVTNNGDDRAPFLAAYVAHGGLVETFFPSREGFDVTGFGDAELLYFVGEHQTYALLPITETRRPDRFYVALVGGYALAHEASLLDVLQYPASADRIEPGGVAVRDLIFAVGEDFEAARAVIREHLGADPCVEVAGVVLEEGDNDPIPGAHVTALSVLSSGSEGIDLANLVTDAEGRFRFCLEAGAVRLIAGQVGRPYAGGGSTPGGVDLDVTDSAPEAVTLRLPPTGRFRAAVADSAGGPLPSRVIIIGIDPSPHSYRLSGDGFDPLAPGVTQIADTTDGAFDFQLEPGDYDAVFTRGPEYSSAVLSFTVEAGGTVDLEATLFRVVDTTGYLSGDFHVHAQAGPDSTVPNEARVANMVAEGVEILVSTDHAFITDYRPTIDALGVGQWLATIPGQEVTTFDYGHFNLFPLPFNPEKPNNGAIDWVGLPPDRIASRVLGADPPGVIQLNHPRAIPAPGATGNYFTAIDIQFDETGPRTGSGALDPLTVRLNAGDDLLSTRFVAVEVMTWLNVQGLSDWTNFLNAGIRFTATGNSDTHTTRVESSGWPRNFVYVGHDDPAELAVSELVDALHQGRNTVSFGPFVTLSALGADGVIAEIGDTVAPDDEGNVTITVRVQAPTWVTFDRVVIYDGGTGTEVAGGDVVPERVSTGEAEGADRYDFSLEHVATPEEDTWFIAIVSGSESLFPEIPYNESDRETLTIEQLRNGDVEEPATAFAITNPIWVDADDNGEIDASHLVLEPDYLGFRKEDRTNPY
jgi:hypothetical protein